MPASVEPPAAGGGADEAVIGERGWILWSGSWASWGRSGNHRKPQSECWNRGEKRLKESGSRGEKDKDTFRKGCLSTCRGQR